MIRFARELADFCLVILIASFINERILQTDKWYAEVGILLLVFILYDAAKLMFRDHSDKEKNPEQLHQADQISADALEEVKKLKASGNMVEAVKKVRDETGVGLLEAKQYVDQL